MNAHATNEQRDTIRELDFLLRRAGKNGTLEQLGWTLHPTTINEFCDGVAHMAAVNAGPDEKTTAREAEQRREYQSRPKPKWRG